MRKFLFKDKEFYSILFSLAVPIALQNFITNALNMVDTMMIGRLGEKAIAAVGLANQLFFVIILFMFGITSGSAIFTAQFWGKKDITNIRRVLGISLICTIATGVFFTVIALFIPDIVISVFTEDTEVIALSSKYLRIVCFSYIITGISFCYSFILRSTEQAKLPMRVSVVAILINTGLNYLLIFGNFGFPQMGVEGAALATVICRVIEITLILGITYKNKLAPAASIKEMLDISKSFFNKFFHTILPVIGNEVLWSVGVTMYYVVYGRMGTNVLAAVNISSTVEKIALVLFVGMASACAVMVGNRIGAGEEDKAYDYAKRLGILAPLMGIGMGLILALVSGRILLFYGVEGDVYESARSILIIFSILMPIKIYNMISIVGILRSGGDTRFSLIIDTTGIWFIAIPIAFISGLVLKLPLHIVFILINLEEFFKFTLGVRRFVSRKWINNLLY